MYVKIVTRTRTLAARRQRRAGTCELGSHVVSLKFPELRNLTKIRDLLASINNDEAAAAEDDALDERKAVKADFIRNHPTYDRTFWVLSQKNPLRTFCQMLVRPVGGERIYGARPSTIAHTIFQLVLLIAVIGGIVVESIATPHYRRDYYAKHGRMRGSWFDIAESVFGLTLVVEFVVKIIADGFSFTPNAYVRSIWNVLDFFI